MKKILFVVPLICICSPVMANPSLAMPAGAVAAAGAARTTQPGQDACALLATLRAPSDTSATAQEEYRTYQQNVESDCQNQRAREQAGRDQQAAESRTTNQIMGGNRNTACNALKQLMGEDFNTPPQPPSPAQNAPNFQKRVDECKQLKYLSEFAGNEPFEQVDRNGSRKQSLDGAITCMKSASYTVDYDACVGAAKLYDGVKVAEKAMDMQQTVRAQAKQREMEAEMARRAAEGDLQAGALDSGIGSHDHMKGLMKEKIMAYTMAVGLLTKAVMSYPGKKKAVQTCTGSQAQSSGQTCDTTVQSSEGNILANKAAKDVLITAIAEMTAKGIAAWQAMGAHDEAAKAIAKAKQPFEDEAGDLMLERCQFNPADPACLGAGERISGGQFTPGEFSLGNGAGNALNMNPEGGEFGEVGAETNIDDSNEVASINNPFSDDAKRANDILNPAGAAQVTPGGGANGGGGGGGGGLGGGGASLGNDVAGADKDGDGEPKIKTGKVSGAYGAVGGGGYRGIARSKENANPFASLFDQKGSAGGTEVEGVEAGISGKASGLFQKISSRYNKIHADKRIEAKNLE